MPLGNHPHLHVACAIIERGDHVLVAQRGAAMSMTLKWEFPGGKIKSGESPEGCLHREILEELGVRVAVSEALPPATHDYPALRVTLYPFICAITAGELSLHEHAAVVWLPPGELAALDWAEADIPVVAAYCRQRHRAPALSQN